MKNPFEALKKHLREDAKNGSRLAILFAQIALFTATIFLWNTKLRAEHDCNAFKTACSYCIIDILVSNSNRLSGLGFIRGTCGCKVNSIANLICWILAIVLEKFYEKSLSSLGLALSITVLFVILLVIIRSSTDLGLFGFLIGVIGSVAYNLFGLKFQTWIAVAICFPLLVFRFWLDKNWLEEGEDRLEEGEDRWQVGQYELLCIIEELTVGCFHVFWIGILYRTNCQGIFKSLTCPSISERDWTAGFLTYLLLIPRGAIGLLGMFAILFFVVDQYLPKWLTEALTRRRMYRRIR